MSSFSYSRTSKSAGRAARAAFAAAADFVFPPVCAGCDSHFEHHPGAAMICPQCLTAIRSPQPACRRCAAPMSAAAEQGEDCALCRGVRLHFDQAAVLGIYRAELREFVLRMKRPAGEALTLAIGQVLASEAACQFESAKFDAVLPVPMPWVRRLVRGANSPRLLAEAIARRLRVRPVWRVLRCMRNPKRQSSLPPSKRFSNVRGAYGLAKGYDFNGASLLLVDDIMTTGATASEAAKVLKRAGAASVSVVAAARGVGEL